MPASQPDFPSLFNELTTALGLMQTGLDPSGERTLIFKKDIPVTIHFNEAEQEVTVVTVVADMESITNRYELMQNLMRANYFWMATKGFTLAVDKASLQIVLIGREHANYFPDMETLAHYLMTFADIAWNWRELSKIADAPDIPLTMFPPQEETLS